MTEAVPSRRRRRRHRRPEPAPTEPAPTEPAPSASPEAEPRRRRRRRKPRAVPPASPPPERESLEAKAARALALIGEVAETLSRQERLPSGPLSLALALPCSGEALVAAVRGALEARRPVETVFREGAVFCFQCASAACSHATPPEPTAVFTGYAPTGKPTWRPFLELCLARKVEGVETLYGEPPGLVALVMPAAELRDDLLPSFGQASAAFAVLGQVVAGFVPKDLRRGEKVALTVQVVETRLAGPSGLRLNLLGLSLEGLGEVAAGDAPRGPSERLRRTLAQARSRLTNLSMRLKTPRERLEAVGPVLSRLRSDLIRLMSPREDRTHHAETRHEGASRPTSSAPEDALHAGDEHFFLDTHTAAVVVVGKRGRAHAFNEQGQLVTSFWLEPGELDRKVGQGRWTPLLGLRLSAFREALRARLRA